jgi:DNA processing protein
MPRVSAPCALGAPLIRLHPATAAWPAGFADFRAGDRPTELHVAGTLPDLKHAVAVVGTRKPDEDARTFARELGAALALAGRVVISGGAHGIDSAAHRGSLDAGGATVAVLATGFRRAYPQDHATLFQVIAGQGALVCEELDPPRVMGTSFLHRNRLIAALAESVVVVQAPARSGALSTARWAKELGRRLLVVPSAPWEVRGRGCLDLLRSGAQICTSVMDVLSLPASGSGRSAKNGARRSQDFNDDTELSECTRALWKLLRRGPRYPDELGVCLDMPAARVQEGLLSLQLMGRVRRRVDGTYETTRRS